MIRIILAFILIFFSYYWGIQGFRMLNGKEKLELTRIVAYSIMCAVLTVASLAVFVYTF